MNISLTSKLQPVFIILAALAGIITGSLNPFIARYLGNCVEVFLMAMLFFVFLTVNIKEIAQSFTDPRFSISALAINFIWTPLFTVLLAKLFMKGQIDLQMGFIMLMVTPCTDWYLIFTGLAGGNTALASSLLPLNLVLQILLLPLYLLLFMGKTVSFDGMIIIKSIAFALVMPLGFANAAKIIFNKINKQRVLKKITAKSEGIQFLLLCLAIVSMFASEGALLFENVKIFLYIVPPLLLFFAVNFALAFFTGKKLSLSFSDTVPLIFTTSARNSPVALAIAAITFPLQPVISLVLIAGPLIELPVLALNAALLKRMGKTRGRP